MRSIPPRYPATKPLSSRQSDVISGRIPGQALPERGTASLHDLRAFREPRGPMEVQCPPRRVRLPRQFRRHLTLEDLPCSHRSGGRNDARRVSEGAVSASPGRRIRLDEEGESTPWRPSALRMRFRRAVALVEVLCRRICVDRESSVWG